MRTILWGKGWFSFVKGDTMVDVTRKHVAPEHRILVNAKTFLNTEFNDAVLFLTGGHIELLRNLVAYASRRSTWVSAYYIGYYLSPDDTDWDLIQRRVAELEYTLMGNNNVIWGYTDRFAEPVSDTSMPAGTSDILGALVPEGKVWEVTGMSATAISATCDRMRVGYKAGDTFIFVGEKIDPGSDVLYTFPMDVILKEGDRLFWRLYGMTLNEDMYGFAWGYKMEVPTA